MKDYNLNELNKLARSINYNRDSLEKVLRLSELLKLFNENKNLKSKYVLKGGTAINLCIFDFPRLSVDIDLNFNYDCNKEEMLEIREKHRKIIESHVALEGYSVDSRSRFTYTLDSYLLKYINAIGRPDNIKIEINYSNRIQILEPVIYNLDSSVIDNKEILALSKIELYGSKIAALIGRTTTRDIFDVYQMIDNNIINDFEMNVLKKCSIFYLLTSNEYQSIEKLLEEFCDKLNNVNFNNIRRNLIPMLKVGTQIDIESYKSIVEAFIENLFVLDDKERIFIESFNSGEYLPNLLFNDALANKILKHPMALWKIKMYSEIKG